MSRQIELVIPSTGKWNLSKFLDNKKVESVTITGFVLFQNAKVGAKELLPGQFGRVGLSYDLFSYLKSDKLAMIKRIPLNHVKLENNNGIFNTDARKIIILANSDIVYDPRQEFDISCNFSNSDWIFKFQASVINVKAVIVEFVLSDEQVETIDLQSKNQFIVPVSHNPDEYSHTKIKKSLLTRSNDNTKLIPYITKFIFKAKAEKNDYIWVSGKILRRAIDKEIGTQQNVVLDTDPIYLLPTNQKNILAQYNKEFNVHNNHSYTIYKGTVSAVCVDLNHMYDLNAYSDHKNLVAIIVGFKETEVENTEQSIVNKMQYTNEAVNDYFVDPVSDLDFSPDVKSARNNNSNKNTKEEKEMGQEFSGKVLGKVYGPVPDGTVAMDITGKLVIKPINAKSYKRFDAKKGKMVDMLDNVFKLSSHFAYVLPVSIDTIEVGDIVVVADREFYVVKEIDKDGVIKGINLNDSTMLEIVPESLIDTNISFVPKVINLLNPGQLDPMLMMMVLGDEEDETVDKKTAMVMMMAMNNSGAENNNMNMMLPMLMMDKSNGGAKDLMLPMMMMNQGNNGNMDMNNMLPLMLLGGDDEYDDEDGNFKDLGLAMLMMNQNQTDPSNNTNMMLPLLMMDKSNGKKDMLLMLTLLQKQAQLTRTNQLISKNEAKTKKEKAE